MQSQNDFRTKVVPGILFLFLFVLFSTPVIAQAPDMPEQPRGEEPVTGNPVISIEPPSWQVGDMAPGERRERTVVIKNKGGATLEIRRVRPSSNNIGLSLLPDQLRPNEPIEVKPGESLQFTLVFVAPNTVQPINSFIFIFSNDPVNSPTKISVTGQVVVPSPKPLESYLFYSEDGPDVQEIRDIFKDDLPKLGLVPLCAADIENMKKLAQLEDEYSVTMRANLQLFVGGTYYFFGEQVKKALELLRDGKSLADYAKEVAVPLLTHLHGEAGRTNLTRGVVQPPPIVVDFFWAQNCKECEQKFQPLLQEHISPFGNAIMFRHWDMQNEAVVGELLRSVGRENIPAGATIVAIVGGRNYVAGDETVIPELKKLIMEAIDERNRQIPPQRGPEMTSPSFRATDVTVSMGTGTPPADEAKLPKAGTVSPTTTQELRLVDKVILFVVPCLTVALLVCLYVIITRTKPKS